MEKYYQITIDDMIKRAEKRGTCYLCEHGVGESCYFAGMVTSCISYEPIWDPCIKCAQKRTCKKNGYTCEYKWWVMDNDTVPKNPTDKPCASCTYNLSCAINGRLEENGCHMYKQMLPTSAVIALKAQQKKAQQNKG